MIGGHTGGELHSKWILSSSLGAKIGGMPSSCYNLRENFGYKELDRRLLTLGSNKLSKKHRIEQTVLSAIIPISKREIMDILPDVSMTSVEQILSDMIKDGRIKRIGTTRKARYMKNSDGETGDASKL